MSAGVRVASPEDLPQIVALYSRVYPKIGHTILEGRARYLHQLLFENPWQSPEFSSFVYEDKTGQIVGFLGVIPRPVLFHGQLEYMTISNNYMVDPTSRNSMVGISLAKAFFSSKQKLTVCQPGKGASQKVWKAFGATTYLAYGLSWVWPLRPISYIANRLRERQVSPIITTLMRPVSTLIDIATNRIFTSTLKNSYPTTIRENLTLEALLAAIERTSQHYSLRPLYDQNTLQWLWDLLLQKQHLGELRRRSVHTTGGEQIGYYVYYAQSDGVSFVVQIGARAGSFATVLNDLGNDAMDSGSVALSGWVDSHYIEELSTRVYYLKYRDDPLFIHTCDRNIQSSLERGDTFLSPLESEWWTWFPYFPQR